MAETIIVNPNAGGSVKLSDLQIKSLLSEKMDRSTWWESPWSQFSNFTGVSATDYETVESVSSDSKNRVKPKADIIQVYVDFQRVGGTVMDIPVSYPLTGKPTIGDEQLIGSGEQRKIAYKKIVICPVRKSVTIQTGYYSAEMLKKSEIKLKLLSDGAKDLGEYFRKYKDYNNYLAILQGASHNLTRYGAGNPNLTRWSHPNIMLPNLTEGTFADHSAIAPLTDAFESSLVTHINALHDASPIATTYFSTKTIRNMCAVAASKKIPKISFGDKQGYLLIISDSQMAQLKKDTEYTAAWHSIASMNPTITGIGEGFYEGCWIIVSADVPSVKTTLADVQGNGEFLASTNAECMLTGTSNLADAARIQYGLSIPTFFENAIDAGPYKCAILLGRSALACGYGDKLSFESETWDFKAKKEDAAMMTFGTMRTDILDSDGYFDSGFKENTSSLVCVTYSPLTLSWS